VTNFEQVSSLEAFDDNLLSQRGIGARISYELGRDTIIEDSNIIAAYDQCVAFIDAGKPAEGFLWDGDLLVEARNAASQAANLAEAALNN
jgi:hypothetical protein